tara:strand:- start:51 stop:365 length:315 start_codon:yes stop_codon:yes gene_type:complete
MVVQVFNFRQHIKILYLLLLSVLLVHLDLIGLPVEVVEVETLVVPLVVPVVHHLIEPVLMREQEEELILVQIKQLQDVVAPEVVAVAQVAPVQEMEKMVDLDLF